MKAFLVEYLQFLRARKKLWMIPIVATLLLIIGLIVITEGSAIAPFVYTIF